MTATITRLAAIANAAAKKLALSPHDAVASHEDATYEAASEDSNSLIL
jgi:hypothetical protein